MPSSPRTNRTTVHGRLRPGAYPALTGKRRRVGTDSGRDRASSSMRPTRNHDQLPDSARPSRAVVTAGVRYAPARNKRGLGRLGTRSCDGDVRRPEAASNPLPVMPCRRDPRNRCCPPPGRCGAERLQQEDNAARVSTNGADRRRIRLHARERTALAAIVISGQPAYQGRYRVSFS